MSIAMRARKPSNKAIIRLLNSAFLAGMMTVGIGTVEARCINNQSPAEVKVDISALWINRIQEWVRPGEYKCFPYGFFSSLRLDALPSTAVSVPNSVAEGMAQFEFTTNATTVDVREQRRFKSNGVIYIELEFNIR